MILCTIGSSMINYNTFKLGQIVQLKTTGTLSRVYGAQRGAIAKVARTEHTGEYGYPFLINVKWVRGKDKKAGIQKSGDYPSCDFELIENKQMLFDFMYE